MFGIKKLKHQIEALKRRHENLYRDVSKLFGKWQYYPEIIFAVIDRLAEEELDRRRLKEAKNTIKELKTKKKEK